MSFDTHHYWTERNETDVDDFPLDPIRTEVFDSSIEAQEALLNRIAEVTTMEVPFRLWSYERAKPPPDDVEEITGVTSEVVYGLQTFDEHAATDLLIDLDGIQETERDAIPEPEVIIPAPTWDERSHETDD